MRDWRCTPHLNVRQDSRPQGVEGEILGNGHQVTETGLRELPAHKKNKTDI